MPKIITRKEIEDVKHTVEKFGNGGHIILPKWAVGKKFKLKEIV